MLAAAAGSACAEFAPGEPELRLEIAVSPTPATVGSARVLLTLSDTAGAMRGGATVVVSGRSPWWAHHPDVEAASGGPPPASRRYAPRVR